MDFRLLENKCMRLLEVWCISISFWVSRINHFTRLRPTCYRNHFLHKWHCFISFLVSILCNLETGPIRMTGSVFIDFIHCHECNKSTRHYAQTTRGTSRIMYCEECGSVHIQTCGTINQEWKTGKQENPKPPDETK
jgi:hypothetical protein